MKKRKNPHKIDCVALQNPVAKYARQFNKAQVYADKTSYRRNAKHRKQEASLIALFKVIKEASFSLLADKLITQDQIGGFRHFGPCA